MSSITGFDELKNKLSQMQKAMEELSGTHDIQIFELLTPAFLAEHSICKNAQELFDKSGFVINSKEDFQLIPDIEWDKYISSVSDFTSWNEMLEFAAKEYVKNKICF